MDCNLVGCPRLVAGVLTVSTGKTGLTALGLIFPFSEKSFAPSQPDGNCFGSKAGHLYLHCPTCLYRLTWSDGFFNWGFWFVIETHVCSLL
jgi:hypothetical protein